MNYEKKASNLNGGIIKVDGRLKLARKPSVNRTMPRNSSNMRANSDPDMSISGYSKSGISKKSGLSPPQKYLSSKLLIPRKRQESSYLKEEER